MNTHLNHKFVKMESNTTGWNGLAAELGLLPARPRGEDRASGRPVNWQEAREQRPSTPDAATRTLGRPARW